MPGFRSLAAAAITATILMAACGESPPSVTASDAPLYDGGTGTFGGGHRSDSTTPTTAAPGEAAVNGGGTFGGGH
jgi:hypothetical protein